MTERRRAWKLIHSGELLHDNGHRTTGEMWGLMGREGPSKAVVYQWHPNGKWSASFRDGDEWTGDEVVVKFRSRSAAMAWAREMERRECRQPK